MKDHFRPSRAVHRDRRWPALRHAAKRRDAFLCLSCGSRGDLEVDHIVPVRLRPDLAFDLDNLQTLCVRCHARKTAIEVGISPPDPKRQQWRELVDELRPPQSSQGQGKLKC